MKKLHIFNASIVMAFIALASVGLNGCLKDKCSSNYNYTQWKPVYVADSIIRAAPKFEASRPLKNPGKIYFYKNYMFINEEKEGVHIIDNADVKAPKNIGFITIGGNVDIAIKGDILYADNFVDLIALDISNVTQPRLVSRTRNTFQSIYFQDPVKGWIVDYKPEKVSVDVDCNDPHLNNGGWYACANCDAGFISANVNNKSVFPTTAVGSNTGSIPAGSGIAGSMARFSIYSDYLYTINLSQVNIFNIKQLNSPVASGTFNVGWGIETLFPSGDKLFIGSNTGMFIYDLVNPLAPTQLSVFTHGRACDPVFVDGDIAYVTLRNGTPCNNGNNQLLIVDVKNLRSPQLLKAYNMTNPRGLSVMDNTLYLCDDGFKIFDVTNWDKIDSNMKSQITNFDTYDVISFTLNYGDQKVAMVIGKDGFYQFDVTDPSKPKELSKIPISQ